VAKKPIEKDFAKDHGLPAWNPAPALLSPTKRRRGSSTSNYVFINAQKEYSIMHYSKGEKLTQALKSPEKGLSSPETLKVGKTFNSHDSFSPLSKGPSPDWPNQYKKFPRARELDVYPTTTNFLIRRCSLESLGEEGSDKENLSREADSPGDEAVKEQAAGFLKKYRHRKLKEQNTIEEFFKDGNVYRKKTPAESNEKENGTGTGTGDDEGAGLLVDPPFMRKSGLNIDNCVDNQSVIVRQPNAQIKTLTRKDSMMLDIQNRWKFNQNQVKSKLRITEYKNKPKDSPSQRRKLGLQTLFGTGSAPPYKNNGGNSKPTDISFASTAKKPRNLPQKLKIKGTN
jgi:hypothetical protein